MDLAHLFHCWERELVLFLSTTPSHEEFWSYWIEREDAVEKMVRPGDEALVEASYDRLFALADAHGFVRLPTAGSHLSQSEKAPNKRSAPDLVSAYRKRSELHRLAMALTDWISSYDPSGKTYRDFQRDYAEAANSFHALLSSRDIPEDIKDDASMVTDLIVHFGYDPIARMPPRSLDDLIEPASPLQLVPPSHKGN